MKDETKDRICTLLTVVIVLLVIAGGLVKATPLYRQYMSLKQQDADRDARIHELGVKTAELIDRERRFRTDPEFVRSVARENQRYHPHEFVVIFSNDGSRKK